MYFISFLRLATEQHSTLPQKGGINGKVYLLNKMNNFTSSRPTLWLKSSRNCSGGWRGLVGGFSYYIKIFYQIYCIKIYIWKRGKPKSAKHRRILMPIWFHSLTILPGSAAGAAALKYTNGVIPVWGTYQPFRSFLKVVKSPSLLGQILLAPPLLLHHQPTAGWILLPSTSPLRLGRLQTEVLASRSPVGGYLILRTDPVVCPDCNIQDALLSNIIREIAD